MQHFLICALLLGCVFAQSCTYNGNTYNDGDGFPSSDGCNRCACSRGSVMCTLMACPTPDQPAPAVVVQPAPVTVKAGKCPVQSNSGSFGICSESCTSDSDCDGEKKCCTNGCGHSCQDPVKQGSCPDGSNPMNCFVAPCTTSKCSVEGATCANNYCGGCKAIWTTANGSRVCDAIAKPRPPYKPKPKGACPDGSNPVNCFVAPCTTSKCEVEGAKCADSYCGGCRAIWTANGARVCAGNITKPRPIRRPRPQVPKVGPCPGGKFPSRCLMAPCAISKCDVEGAVCSNNYCGGCKAIWTANGATVCAEPTVPTTKPGFCPPVPKVESDTVTRSAGQCGSTCFYDSDCTGSSKCCSNGCGRICTPATGGVKPAPSCAVVLCASGTQCVNSPTGPRCVATAVTQALADQQSTYDSSSTSDNSSVAGWAVVVVAAIVAVALFAVAIVIMKRLQ